MSRSDAARRAKGQITGSLGPARATFQALMAEARSKSHQGLVKRLEEEQVTKGGIIIPDSAKEKPIKGEVVAAGPGKVADDGKQIPMVVKTGDKVIFNKYAGTEIKIDGDELLIMREDDILAVIEA